MRSANGAEAVRSADWRRRIGTASFRRELEGAVHDEITAAGSLRIGELVDASAIRAALAEIGPGLTRPTPTARLFVDVNRQVEKRLRAERRSIDEAIGPELRAEIEVLLEEELPKPEALEEILAQVIRQRFVRKLFAELIHSAIISFNKRVNPLFGGITAVMLEDQIRAFIELGMPMLQEQAVAFALRPANQQFAIDLARSLIRGVMAEPLGDLVPPSSAGQRKRIEMLVKKALESERLHAAAPALALRFWDDLYPRLRGMKFDALVDVERVAEALSAPIAAALTAVLSRGRIAEVFGSASD
jgi:hypothetical protein